MVAGTPCPSLSSILSLCLIPCIPSSPSQCPHWPQIDWKPDVEWQCWITNLNYLVTTGECFCVFACMLLFVCVSLWNVLSIAVQMLIWFDLNELTYWAVPKGSEGSKGSDWLLNSKRSHSPKFQYLNKFLSFSLSLSQSLSLSLYLYINLTITLSLSL